MIVDLEAGNTGELACEVAVVGAGAVGITMAVELARRGHDVLLLEAGGESLEPANRDLFEAAMSIGHPLPGLHSGRFRMLGGTTNFWGGQLAPFGEQIFERRPWLPQSGWPFGRETLTPYYQKTLDLLSLTCGMDDDDVWRRIATTPPKLGDSLEIFFTRWLPKPNLSRLFGAELRGGGMRTVVHANVTALETDETDRRVSAVHLRTLDGKSAVVRPRHVVLACGTIEISRLLMLPLATGRPAPWASLPWLGRGFVDHVDCFAGDVEPIDKAAFHALFDNVYVGRNKYNPKVRLSEKTQARERLLDISAQFAFLSDHAEHLSNLRLFVSSLLGGKVPSNVSQIPGHVFALWRVAAPLAIRYLKANRAFNPTDRGIRLRLTGEQFPNERSRIFLGEERDALGLPVAKVDWALDGRELETFAAFGRHLKAGLSDAGLAKVHLDPRIEALDPAFLQTVDDGYHQMGGARMSTSPADGVVDPDLRVHGTENLFVAGAAVYPSTGFPNPTFTAMALGLRLVDHLGER